MPEPTFLVPFMPDDGSNAVMLTIIHIDGYPRGVDGTCAFCHGDPCAETSPPESLIAQYFERNLEPNQQYGLSTTCPCCDGRPT